MKGRAWLFALALGLALAGGTGCAKGFLMVPCGTCHGSGKVKCAKCDAQGLGACVACRGWGIQCCPVCASATPRKTCERCREQIRNCAKCKGTAEEDCAGCEKGLKRDGSACGICKGKGTRPCRTCIEGKEQACVCCAAPPKPEFKANAVICVPCGGKALAKCAACAGAIHVACPRCGGTGKFKSETKSGGGRGRDWD